MARRLPAKGRCGIFPLLARIVCGVGISCFACASACAQATPQFPADNVWIPLRQAGAIITDPAGDTALGQTSRDVVGDSGDPAAFVYSDADFLYFRLRVDGAANLANNGYGCELDSDGNEHDYEFFALSAKTAVQLWANTLGRTDSITDIADSLLQTYTPFATYAAATAAGSSLNGSADGFAQWAVAWSDLPYGAETALTPLHFVCGTNSSGTPGLNDGTGADVLGDESAGSLVWHVLASDQYQCGSDGCFVSACPSPPGGVGGPDFAFISADHATFMAGEANQFQVIPIGCPIPAVAQGGNLPAGVSFDPSTLTLSGSPDDAAAGGYPITFTASNGVPDDVVQIFTLTVLANGIFADSFEAL